MGRGNRQQQRSEQQPKITVKNGVSETMLPVRYVSDGTETIYIMTNGPSMYLGQDSPENNPPPHPVHQCFMPLETAEQVSMSLQSGEPVEWSWKSMYPLLDSENEVECWAFTMEPTSATFKQGSFHKPTETAVWSSQVDIPATLMAQVGHDLHPANIRTVEGSWDPKTLQEIAAEKQRLVAGASTSSSLQTSLLRPRQR